MTSLVTPQQHIMMDLMVHTKRENTHKRLIHVVHGFLFMTFHSLAINGQSKVGMWQSFLISKLLHGMALQVGSGP
jgi:hypothetical protein